MRRRLLVTIVTALVAGCAGQLPPPGPAPTPTVYVSREGPILNLRMTFTAGPWIYSVTTPHLRADRPLILAVRIVNRTGPSDARPSFRLEDAMGRVVPPRYQDPIPDEPATSARHAYYMTYPISTLTPGLVFVVDPHPGVAGDVVRFSLDTGRVHYPGEG